MTDDLMEELRIMANEHDDRLCQYALDRFAMLEEALSQYRGALSQSSCRIKEVESSLRDQFAMAALPALIKLDSIETVKEAAGASYYIADAMLKAREAK